MTAWTLLNTCSEVPTQGTSIVLWNWNVLVSSAALVYRQERTELAGRIVS